MYGQEITKENVGMVYLQLMYFSTQDMFLLGRFLDREGGSAEGILRRELAL